MTPSDTASPQPQVLTADASTIDADAPTIPNWLFMACGLSWGAALIHVSAAIGHLDESGMYVAFFAALAPIQLAWGFLVCRRATPRVLMAGLVLSVLVALVWAMSRTTGLPIGPNPWHPEEVGAVDVIATLDELTLALLVWLYGFTTVSTRSARVIGTGAKAFGLMLVVLSSLALLTAGHVS
jgi:hypothetical protein